MHRFNCSILDVGAIGEVFLYTFHWNKIFEKLCGIKLSQKIGLKTFQLEFSFVWFVVLHPSQQLWSCWSC